jgi:hypothetical protein
VPYGPHRGYVGYSASFPTLQALCAHLNSPGTTCTFAPDNCPVADADRYLLAPCTFCGRYFRSCGPSRHQHHCFHRNTTPSQPPACGVSLARGRSSPVRPESLTPAVQWCLDHGAIGGENSKAFFESYLISFRSITSSNGVLPSVARLVKPVFEELVGCVLSLQQVVGAKGHPRGFRGSGLGGVGAIPALSFAPHG